MKYKINFIIALLILILGSIAFFLNKSVDKLPITEVYPSHNEQQTSTETSMRISFEKALAEEILKGLTLSLSPDTVITSRIIDPTTIEFTPSQELNTNQKYTATLLQKEQPMYTWTFTTSQRTTKERQDQFAAQLEKEKANGQFFQELYQAKPFLTKLPINTDAYLIVYDTILDQFVVGLKDEAAREQAVEAIGKIVPNISPDTIIWKNL